jgi:hypothetical protein
MLLVLKPTIPTERLTLVRGISANFCGESFSTRSAQRVYTAVNLGFLDRSRYFYS